MACTVQAPDSAPMFDISDEPFGMDGKAKSLGRFWVARGEFRQKIEEQVGLDLHLVDLVHVSFFRKLMGHCTNIKLGRGAARMENGT